MGEILNCKKGDNKVLYSVLLNDQEAKALKGHLKNVYLFSKNQFIYETKFFERGNQRGAKYFLMPSLLRPKRRNKFLDIKYHVLEEGNHLHYIYIANKEKRKKI